MPKKVRSHAAIVSKWRGLGAGFANNASDLPHLGSHSQQLDALKAQAESIMAQQAVHTAAKQELSKQLVKVLDVGEKLATFLCVGVRQHYGRTEEKLVEFGLQPFRGLKRAAPDEPQE